jgi:transcription elongation factor GreA
MPGKEISITREGYEKLLKELDRYKSEVRKEVAEKLKLARSFGDLSENSEYDEAKEEQARVETKIAEMEYTIKNAVIIDPSKNDKSEVSFGATIKVYDIEFDEEIEYTIVGSKEVDAMNNKISSESPAGKAMIGKKVGEIAQVLNSEGQIISEFKILEIL